MQTVTTWRDQEDEPYTKVINEAFPEPEPNTQYPHRPDYVGPSNLGKAGRAVEGDVVTAGLAYGATKAITPIAKILGPAGIIDAGINIVTGESDTPFEKKLEIFKPAKVAAKSIRLFNRWGKNMLDDVFDRRTSPEDYLEVSLTGPKDLNLYGASPNQFEVITNMNAALAQEVPRGGRRVKYGNHYYTIHKKKGETVMTPYNKWYQQNVDPFKIPKDLEAKWRSQEPQQLDITEIGGKKVQQQYGTKGKTREVKQTIRYPSGTVDEFKAWYKNIFDLQQEERALMQQLSTIAEKADLVEARPKGKKFFDMDKSHIVPRSRGGSGLTFLEAWLANQKRGNDWILDPSALDRAGIPKNWDELFNAWYAAKKGGKELQTGLGPLDNINVDDYFSIEDGQDLSIVARRRQNIRNLVNRQIGNPDTALIKGNTGTIADDYRNLVLESKGYDQFDDPKLHNPKILDIGYAAENYEGLIELGEL